MHIYLIEEAVLIYAYLKKCAVLFKVIFLDFIAEKNIILCVNICSQDTLRFAKESEVPFTNNAAEREIRMCDFFVNINSIVYIFAMLVSTVNTYFHQL